MLVMYLMLTALWCYVPSLVIFLSKESMVEKWCSLRPWGGFSGSLSFGANVEVGGG